MSVVARPRVEDGLRRGVLGGHLETQTSRVGPDDETAAPDGFDSPLPPPISTCTVQRRFSSMNAYHQRQITYHVVPLIQIKRAHVPAHGESIQSWETVFTRCKDKYPHLFGGLTGKPRNASQTLKKAFESYIDAWSRADKQGQKAPGISEEYRTLDATLIVLKGEMDAAKSESEAKTADKKQKAVQERVEIEVARSIRKRAIYRAQPAEVDEDANPFTSRRATEVRHQIEAASGDVVEACTRMANTVNAPKKVRGQGKKRKNDADFMFFRDGRE